ncbi:Glycosyltransferase family 62 protein [Balamuthia mandrillaris]
MTIRSLAQYAILFCILGLTSLTLHLYLYDSSAHLPASTETQLLRPAAGLSSTQEQEGLPSSLWTGPLFHMQWNDARLSSNGLFRVVTAAEDHRSFPPPRQLTRGAYSRIFPHTKKPHKRIFQFHAVIHDNLTFTPTFEVFSTVELWTYHNDALASFAAPDAFVLKKRPAINCIAQQPLGREFRHKYGAVWMDFVIRCAFDIPPEALEDAFCHHLDSSPSSPPSSPASTRRNKKCKAGHFAIHATDDVVLFPVDEVLHFPTLWNALPQAPSRLDQAHAFAAAPWRVPPAHPRSNEPPFWPIERATGEEANVSVCTFVVKKYTWTGDDELWLQWMVDVVGVDRVFINLFAQPNERLPSAETLRARLATHHPALVHRVVFVETQVPGTHETHEHMLQAMNWDAFLRWQGECQYAFSLDTDEFVQLYSSKELEEGQPHHRVDVKQFIAEHPEELEGPMNVAHMARLRFSRENPASEEEPLLGAFLARAARWEGILPQLGDWRAHKLGKSLFRVRGSLEPHLHTNENGKRTKFPKSLPREVAHILHIRVKGGIFDNEERSSPSLAQLLSLFECQTNK